jgi:hypothetical protein
MTTRLFTLLSFVAVLTGGCILEVEADVPEVEITQHGVKMPGVPLSKAIGDVSITSEIPFSSSNSAWAKRMNSEVFVSQVRVTAESGLSNLDFVKLARLTMNDPSTPSRESTQIVSYERHDQAPSSSVLDVSPQAPVDITRLWAASQTLVELELAGSLPEKDWAVSVTLKVAGKIKYKF